MLSDSGIMCDAPGQTIRGSAHLGRPRDVGSKLQKYSAERDPTPGTILMLDVQLPFGMPRRTNAEDS